MLIFPIEPPETALGDSAASLLLGYPIEVLREW
jgi:hypothetical protein